MRQSRPGKTEVGSGQDLYDNNIWVLRSEFNTRNTTSLSTRLPKNSCLKSTGNKSEKNKSCPRKANKCVHYAPFISQGKMNYSFLLLKFDLLYQVISLSGANRNQLLAFSC